MLYYTIILCVLSVLVNSDQIVNKNHTKLIIDNDAGTDDAMGIFLALLYEKYSDGPQVVALTTTHGNAEEEKVCVNNQRILKLAKREDVPIFRGSKKSLVLTAGRDDFYGVDGLGDAGEIPKDLVEVQQKGAVEALIELSKTYEGNLVVVTLGSLTNVALAISLDPEFLGRLKHLYLAAGFVKSERFPNAEFNARTDVEAYHIVMQAASPDKVTVVPYSTSQLTLDIEKEWRQDVLGAIQTDIIRALNAFERTSIEKHQYWDSLDPATVAIALKPDLAQKVHFTKNEINLCGQGRGIINNKFHNEEIANARLVHAVKKESYKHFLFEVFSFDSSGPVNR